MVKVKSIILAAGKGSRMKSNLPKSLIEINKKSMIEYVLENIENISEDITIVVGYKKELIIDKLKKLNKLNLNFINQEKQLGTGHATLVTKEYFSNYNGNILITFGDAPFISRTVFENMLNYHIDSKCVATILTKETDNTGTCARIIRNEKNKFLKSIEFKDLQEEYKNVNEINVGVIICNSNKLFEALNMVNNNNSQNEYYLPDVINILSKQYEISIYKSLDIPDFFSFNTIDEINKVDSNNFHSN